MPSAPGKCATSQTGHRITFDPDQCGRLPCIRDIGTSVTDVLVLLANGLSFRNIIKELPDLECDDIVASIKFATRRIVRAVAAA